ncbi:hypothetical protein QWI17_18980 [Gilvimarinus sp. SDUM040013]|uniref:Uncharacterized protein n=1 Tax=Gilvimarinus gilvus TaxID=3058038 RepID=A0ABU4RV04_9GAMM|nr:hypothetical protein [Gilvimarinus sp. SDUM040013]MDO3387937.1 hypothetical protein [Gilvimarinus sp. SDUM040013]MDX6848692.1 hypothetical protein [Gilvimarinus sp. SDUM040013]
MRVTNGKLWSACAVLVSSFIFLMYFGADFRDMQVKEHDVAGGVVGSNEKSLKFEIKSPVPDVINSAERSEAHRLEHEEFYSDYIVGVDKSSYSDYELDTLLDLAESGDVRAMKTAAIKYLEMSESQDDATILDSLSKMKGLVESAVVHGDRELIELLSSNFFEKSVFLSDEYSGLRKEEEFVKAYAFYDFVGLRGNFSDKYYGQKNLSKIYYPEKTYLTSAEVEKIKAQAQSIYDSFEKKRVELGLGPFDNTIPPTVQAGFDALKDEYFAEMGGLAYE